MSPDHSFEVLAVIPKTARIVNGHRRASSVYADYFECAKEAGGELIMPRADWKRVPHVRQ